MIPVYTSGARFSSIVGLGEKINRLEKEKGKPYLRLNRGINAVVKLNLDEVIPHIDFNSADLQFYPPNNGMTVLKDAINRYYFDGNTQSANIFITSGGMSGLDLIFKTLNIKEVASHTFYWGAYSNVLKINQMEQSFYRDVQELIADPQRFAGKAVIICDPNNPLGNKIDDQILLKAMRALDEASVTVIFDSPYRKLFYQDDFHVHLLKFNNLIICDSFSKALGLSGQRIGYIHSNQSSFNEEFRINLLYANNGVNAFAQLLITKLLDTAEGQKAVKDFQQKTTTDIAANMNYLQAKNLLVDELYEDSLPLGIFTIIKASQDYLLDNQIGSVGINYFTKDKEMALKPYSRICVSVPHEQFTAYFNQMLAAK